MRFSSAVDPDIDPRVGKCFWICGTELCMGEVLTAPSSSKAKLNVWWWGPDSDDLAGSWNRLVCANTKKPLKGRIAPGSILRPVKFSAGSGAVNRVVGPHYPHDLVSELQDFPSSSSDSDVPLAPPAPPPPPFTSRKFLYDSILRSDRLVGTWSAHWDLSGVLDARFLVWLHNCPGLTDRSSTLVNVQRFWSSKARSFCA